MIELFNRERPLLTVLALALTAVVVQQTFRPSWQRHRRVNDERSYLRKPSVDVPQFFKDWRGDFLRLNALADRRGLFRGIFLGDDSSVSAVDRRSFREAGLSHVLAASGFNCWIVATAFGLLAQILLSASASRLPSDSFLAARCVITPLSRVSGAWIFWLWSDQSAPITRSASMISLAFGLGTLGYRAAFARLLVVHYSVSLAIMPRLWSSASFQLTYGCLVGLIALPALLDRFKPSRGEMLWNHLTTGLGACLGALPTTLIMFGELNFNSIVTNLFAVPIVSFALMPIGMMQMFILLLPESDARDIALNMLASVGAESAEVLARLVLIWSEHFPSLRYVI